MPWCLVRASVPSCAGFEVATSNNLHGEVTVHKVSLFNFVILSSYGPLSSFPDGGCVLGYVLEYNVP